MTIKQIAGFLGLTLLLAGCVTKRPAGPLYRAGEEQMPEFLNGPAALLLTNIYGFSAHVSTDIVRPYSEGKTLSGSLLERQGRFVFQPDQIIDKKHPAVGILFIWDANLRKGWTVSEALQGFAPLSTPLEVTNVEILGTPGIPELVNNTSCHRVEARIARADGTVAAYKVWQADESPHFPLRIQSDSGGKTMTLTFSDLILQSPAADLFNPPDGFVKYESPVAMMNELITRETTVGQRKEATELDAAAIPARGANIYQPEPAH